MINFSICGSNGMNYLSIASDDMGIIDDIMRLLEDKGADIKKSFVLDNYIGKYAMHCPSYHEFCTFMRTFNINAVTIPIDESVSEYLFDVGSIDGNGRYRLISKESAARDGYTILEYDDFNWREDAFG